MIITGYDPYNTADRHCDACHRRLMPEERTAYCAGCLHTDWFKDREFTPDGQPVDTESLSDHVFSLPIH